MQTSDEPGGQDPNRSAARSVSEQAVLVAQARVALTCVDAFDRALDFQLRTKDDATMAIWTAIGLEAATLGAVLASDPATAYGGGTVPTVDEILADTFRTARFPDLVAAAQEGFPDATYPPDADSFMAQIRNKLMHVGTSKHVGLASHSLRIMEQVARWLDEARPLADLKLRHRPRVLDAARTGELGAALPDGIRRTAADLEELLESGIGGGRYDDEDLRTAAERELRECREIRRRLDPTW